MMEWTWIDESRIRWLRGNLGRIVRLDLRWLPDLMRLLDLRVAAPLGRTKFGAHREEYRERRKWLSIHVREFDDRLEIHADKLNPDWGALSFVGHVFSDVLGVG